MGFYQFIPLYIVLLLHYAKKKEVCDKKKEEYTVFCPKRISNLNKQNKMTTPATMKWDARFVLNKPTEAKANIDNFHRTAQMFSMGDKTRKKAPFLLLLMFTSQ